MVNIPFEGLNDKGQMFELLGLCQYFGDRVREEG